MTYLNPKIHKKLNIYVKKYNQQYIKCLIRGIEIPVNGRPEELVRQIFIDFLVNESKVLSDFIHIKVEVNNHDIEIYKKHKNDNFKPHQNPLVIVEVKREEASLENHYNQIKRYLTKADCNIGVLYNYHEIIIFIKNNSEFEIGYLKTLKNIEELIIQNINTNNDNLLLFEKAQNGDFDSFISLIGKYGKYTTNKITFKLKHQESEIQGYLFNIQDNKIYYKICGQYSKKQQSFDYQYFDKLISIIY